MKKEKILRTPVVRILIVISTVLVLIAAISVLSAIFYRTLFHENRHFLLKNIIVKSSGYWNGRSNEIAEILDLKKGKDNLFRISASELKKELMVKKEYSIENAEVIKKLPDTLVFNIMERIPRALLYNKNSDLLVDGDCILINKKYCVKIDSELPIITGFKIKDIKFSQSLGKEMIPYGRLLFQLKPAMGLILQVNTNYPQFDVKLINLYNENELTVFMAGPIGEKIILIRLPFLYSKDIPLSNAEFNEGMTILKLKLSELKKLFKVIRLKGQAVNEIDMLYKDRAVVR